MATLQSLWAEQQVHLRDMPRGEKEAHYLAKHLDFEPSIKRHLRAIERMLPHVRGRVLEWGCRHAPDSVILRLCLGDTVELHGADVRDSRLFTPFHQASGIAYTRLEDPVRLPYADGHFDTIVGHGVLEHVQQPEASLDELFRVLAPGGKLLIDAMPNRFSYTEWVLRRLGRDSHTFRLTRPEFSDLLERHGFEVLNIGRAEMLPAILQPGGTKLRGVYRRAAPLLRRVNRALQRRPFDLVATNLFALALKPGGR